MCRLRVKVTVIVCFVTETVTHYNVVAINRCAIIINFTLAFRYSRILNTAYLLYVLNISLSVRPTIANSCHEGKDSKQ